MVTTGAIRSAKLQSNHHQQQINIQLFTGRMPFLSHNCHIKMKKVLRDANTARWLGRSQKILPRHRPPSRGRGAGQNLISWRWPLYFTYKPSLVRSMHAISSYRGSRPINTPTNTRRPPVANTQTYRQDR